jgi:hypothetical protein
MLNPQHASAGDTWVHMHATNKELILKIGKTEASRRLAKDHRARNDKARRGGEKWLSKFLV